MCAQSLRCFKSKYLSFFSAQWVSRYLGRDVSVSISSCRCWPRGSAKESMIWTKFAAWELGYGSLSSYESGIWNRFCYAWLSGSITFDNHSGENTGGKCFGIMWGKKTRKVSYYQTMPVCKNLEVDFETMLFLTRSSELRMSVWAAMKKFSLHKGSRQCLISTVNGIQFTRVTEMSSQ
jgi:hypothetical protein